MSKPPTELSDRSTISEVREFGDAGDHVSHELTGKCFQDPELWNVDALLALGSREENAGRLPSDGEETEDWQVLYNKLDFIRWCMIKEEGEYLILRDNGRLKRIKELSAKLSELVEEEVFNIEDDLREDALDLLRRLKDAPIWRAPRGRRGAGPSRRDYARELAKLWNEYHPKPPAGAHYSDRHGCFRPNRGGQFVLDALHAFGSPDELRESPRWLARALTSPK
jgi:hypothetical protein